MNVKLFLLFLISLVLTACQKTTEGPVEYQSFLAAIDIDGSVLEKFTGHAYPRSEMQFIPGTEKILVNAREEGLYIINPDGSGRQKVFEGLQVYNVAVSPDGGKIVFQAVSTNLDFEIYLMNTDGSSLFNLTNSVNIKEYFPAFSPAGDKIVYTADGGGPQQQPTLTIYSLSDSGYSKIIDGQIDGPNDFQLIPFWFPQFGSNGDRIYFIREKYNPETNIFEQAIYSVSSQSPDFEMIDPDGSILIQIARSGDGSKIVYGRSQPDGIHIVAYDEPAAALNDLGAAGHPDAQIDISTGGTAIVLSREANADGYNDPIYVLNPDGSGRRFLTYGRSAIFYPGGQRVLFIGFERI